MPTWGRWRRRVPCPGGDRVLRALVACLGRGERRLPSRRPRPGSATPVPCLARRPGHQPGAVGLDRLDERPQRHPDAGVPDVRGEVAVAGRVGRQRLWDLAERVYPAGVVVPRSTGRAGAGRSAGCGARHRPREDGRTAVSRWQSARQGAAVVEGVDGEWRVDPGALDEPFTGRTALLSPFDRLVHDAPRAGSSASSTPSRCTSRRRSGAGATSRCRYPPRPARRETRRQRRPQGVGAPRQRASRGREVRAHGDRRGGRRTRCWPRGWGSATVD